MKLYYFQAACALASHIMLREIGADFELEAVAKGTGRTEAGEDFLAVNPKGQVPTLELESGEVLTEGVAILQFLADTSPSKAFSPPLGPIERARLQEHLNFIASEIHKAFGPLFHGKPDAATVALVRADVGEKLSHIEGILSDGRDYLLGEAFSPADAYLYAVTNWTNFTGIDLAPWPYIQTFMRRMQQRDSVAAALKAEGMA